MTTSPATGTPSTPATSSAPGADSTVALVTLGCTFAAACDVTNPGPVQDEFLAVPASQQGLVNGSVRRLAEAISWEAYTTALAAREIFPGGQTGAHGHDVLSQAGYIRRSDSYGGYFNDAQQARFIAEQAITRFTEVGAPANMMYQAHLWAAFAYRTLGENYCEAVIDGGPIQPGRVYFEKAVDNFTKALSFAATDSLPRPTASRMPKAAPNARLIASAPRRVRGCRCIASKGSGYRENQLR